MERGRGVYVLVMHASDSLTCTVYKVSYFMPVMHELDSPTYAFFILLFNWLFSEPPQSKIFQLILTLSFPNCLDARGKI